MTPKRAAILFLLAVLAGCGPDTRSAAAQARWQSAPVPHYRLRTTDIIAGQSCDQTVEVRGETIVGILHNSCQHPNLWTVGWLFRAAEHAGTPAAPCAHSDPSAGCLCVYSAAARIQYDAALGFPREIDSQLSWAPNWQGFGYWSYAAQHLALPACTPPAPIASQHIVVHELKPLP
ncbi:hypothetical protein SE17_23440 [Kouleothrix aurantiaca]|uniref:Uncharacterized protein n=1 Tax=Kouleothrix aurantiaca TaxID=186479 RepID=A0A0P9DLZ3_9CHLR|nr:hypothetical protein SE17_23440 [Kouleothrix aurantiaca]